MKQCVLYFYTFKNSGCYTCASLEYEHLYKKFQSFRHSMNRPLFGSFCDETGELKRLVPTVRCRSTCVTLVEPQYFGGIQAQDTPFLYIRGCADSIFSAAKESSREIGLLRSEAGCIDLRWSQIWPSIQADELVKKRHTKRNNRNLA
uniref:Secreted protein n=1 Tax=Syphacia muris TaxID=451379 RepID=A0A0N5AVD6_9BILA